MRTWLLFLPILLFAQSSPPPSKSAPASTAVAGANSTEDGATKKGETKQQAPPIATGTATQGNPIAQRATQPSQSDKAPEVTPDPIVRYTFWLVIVGALQFVALIVQAFFLYEAFTETTTATSLTQLSIREAERSNAANETLTRESNVAAQAATELTRQSLILSQRPKLVVRNVAFDDEDRILGWRARPGGGNPVVPTGTLRIVNIGGGNANVISMACRIFLLHVLPMRSPLPFDPVANVLAEPIALPSGKYGTLPFRRPDTEPFSTEDLFQIAGNHIGIYVIGELIYCDDLGNVRTTWFCREWRADGRKRFIPVDNEDYESAD